MSEAPTGYYYLELGFQFQTNELASNAAAAEMSRGRSRHYAN